MLVIALEISVIAGLIYIGFGVLVYVFIDKFVFPGNADILRTPASEPFHWEYEPLRLPVGDAITAAWYIPVENARGAVLLAHGNGENVSTGLEWASVYRTLGFSILIFDYGGYGESTGKPSEQRCYADVRAMWRFLTEQRGIAPDRIVLAGRSLGGGIVSQLATEVTPGAVILESTFMSVPQLAQEVVRILPIRPFIRTRFDNAAKVARFTAPLLVIHSPDDTLVPYRHGRALFERAHEPKQFLEIRGDHNEGMFVSWKQYKAGIEDFLLPLFERPPSAFAGDQTSR